MVYNILNRSFYRGFHSDPAGKEKINKPDGKTAKVLGCMDVWL